MAAGTISLVILAGFVLRLIAKAISSQKTTPELPPPNPQPSGAQQALIDEVVRVLQRHVRAELRFDAIEIANEVRQSFPARTVREIADIIESFHSEGRLTRLGYAKTGNVFHPIGAAPVPPPAFQPVQPTFRAPASVVAPSPPPTSEVDPYQASEILGLSAEQLRKRALKIVPWRTAWIGRVDTIPPQSDERTAIIDRGLILRGLLTPEEIADIHRVGDQWIRFQDAARIAEEAAHESVKRSLEEEREAKAARKLELKRLAAEKKVARAVEVAKRRAEDIIYLGCGVSGRLNDRRAHIEELQRHRLPILASPQDVAHALGLTIPELRWLCFHAEATTRTHYTYFEIAKRSGGTRLLAAPHKKLGRAQRWILQNVLSQLEVTTQAHGFVRGRSTVTNAKQHCGQKVVINLDLQNFFPTISFFRVRGLFESVGYSPSVATILALLCTESPRTAVEHDGTKFWVAVGERALPQGACTSPTISNLVSRKLDRRLNGACTKLGWSYTRYADDLTFSTDGEQGKNTALLLARVRNIVREEGFAINEKKGRVQRAAGRQEVTGIVVNDKLGVPRSEMRRLRAILHGAKKSGLAAQNREGRDNFEAWLRGKIAYVNMVNPEKAKPLRDALDALDGGHA